MKIHSPFPPAVNEAIQENLEGIEFVTDKDKAEIILPSQPLPLKLGEIIDLIAARPEKTLNVAGLALDLSKQSLSLGGKILSITAKEAAILEYLAGAQTAVSREAMTSDIWGYSSAADTKTVENHIYRLRQKIFNEFGREIIATEGGNYKLMEN
jgi:DNA-binding response OmpR family regulator